MKSPLRTIFFAVISAGLFFVLDRFTGIATSFSQVHITYAYPLLNFVSIILGPAAGTLAGALGQGLLQIGAAAPDWTVILCTATNCATIGLLVPGTAINQGIWERSDIIRYNQSQLIVNFGCWALLQPLLSWLIYKERYVDALLYGVENAANKSVSCMVITTLFLAIYARSRITATNFLRN